MDNNTLTHIDQSGNANMVDVSDKEASRRIAIATGQVSMKPETLALIKANDLKKGDVLATARIAGIQGAKQCSNLIPLCHPLMISKVSIDFHLDEAQSKVDIVCECKLVGKTGVEMEALSGVSVAALTIYDMCKAVDPAMIISDIKVQQKQGGKTGLWERDKT